MTKFRKRRKFCRFQIIVNAKSGVLICELGGLINSSSLEASRYDGLCLRSGKGEQC